MICMAPCSEDLFVHDLQQVLPVAAVVEVQAGDGVVALGLGLFLDADGARCCASNSTTP
jgi:hypothetical protein